MDLYKAVTLVRYGALIEYRCPVGSRFYGVNDTTIVQCGWDVNGNQISELGPCLRKLIPRESQNPFDEFHARSSDKLIHGFCDNKAMKGSVGLVKCPNGRLCCFFSRGLRQSSPAWAVSLSHQDGRGFRPGLCLQFRDRYQLCLWRRAFFQTWQRGHQLHN